jgi:hypothetical protein
MEELENLREKLYETIKMGNPDEILRVSQELDIFVLYFVKKQLSIKN